MKEDDIFNLKLYISMQTGVGKTRYAIKMFIEMLNKDENELYSKI